LFSDAPILAVKLQERRRHPRHQIALSTRCMLGDRLEFSCRTIDISPDGVGVTGVEEGGIGERIVAYINQIGRIEGTIARRFAEGFALAIHAPAAKRDKLMQRIAWLIEREASGAPEERQHERIAADNQQTVLRTDDGQRHAAALLDISAPGAALNVSAAPPIGSPVMVGQTAARVVRHFPGGIAVSFSEELPESALSAHVQL
jgi:hypothetical protein